MFEIRQQDELLFGSSLVEFRAAARIFRRANEYMVETGLLTLLFYDSPGICMGPPELYIHFLFDSSPSPDEPHLEANDYLTYIVEQHDDEWIMDILCIYNYDLMTPRAIAAHIYGNEIGGKLYVNIRCQSRHWPEIQPYWREFVEWLQQQGLVNKGAAQLLATPGPTTQESPMLDAEWDDTVTEIKEKARPVLPDIPPVPTTGKATEWNNVFDWFYRQAELKLINELQPMLNVTVGTIYNQHMRYKAEYGKKPMPDDKSIFA